MSFKEHILTIDLTGGNGLWLRALKAGGLATCSNQANPEEYDDSRAGGETLYEEASVYRKKIGGKRGRWLDGQMLVPEETSWLPNGNLAILSSLFSGGELEIWPWVDGITSATPTSDVAVPSGLVYSNYPDSTGLPHIAWIDNDTFILAQFGYDATTRRHGLYVQKFHDNLLVWSRLLHDYAEYSGYVGDMVAPDMKVTANVGVTYDNPIFWAGGTDTTNFTVAGSAKRFQWAYQATRTHFQILYADDSLKENVYETQAWSGKLAVQKTNTQSLVQETTTWAASTEFALEDRICVGSKDYIYQLDGKYGDKLTGATQPEWGAVSVVDNHCSWMRIGYKSVKCKARLENADGSLASAWSPVYKYTYGGTLTKDGVAASVNTWYISEAFTTTIWEFNDACVKWGTGAAVLCGNFSDYTDGASRFDHAVYVAAYDTDGTKTSDALGFTETRTLVGDTSFTVTDAYVDTTLRISYRTGDNGVEYLKWRTWNGTVWSVAGTYSAPAGTTLDIPATFAGGTLYGMVYDDTTYVGRVVAIATPFGTPAITTDITAHPYADFQTVPDRKGFFYNYLLDADWVQCGVAYYGPAGQSNAVWYMGI